MSTATTIHTIRLRGPWTVHDLGAGGPPQTMDHPIRLEAGEWQGPVECRRRFGRPTNLGPGEEVWLCVDAGVGLAAIAVNDTRLDGLPCNITGLLDERNEVVAVLEMPPHGGTDLGDVRLEIRPQRS